MREKKIAVDAIMFDLDGTLFDTIPLIVESYQQMYRRYNKRVHTAEEIKAGIGLPLETVISGEYPEEGAEMLRCYLDYNNLRTATHYGIYLGIGPLLESLHELEIPLAIVTAKRYDNARVTLQTSGLAHYFQALVTKFDTAIHKPDPEPLIIGMTKLGFTQPSRIIYVGDSVHDLQAARNGGFIAAAVEWSSMPHDSLRRENPDIWLRRPQDLAALVRKRQNSNAQHPRRQNKNGSDER